jgi:mono/diheme cytochrome c family protein
VVWIGIKQQEARNPMKRNRRQGIVELPALAVFILGGALAIAADKGDAQKGKTLFEKNCVVCHGAMGKGDGPTGKLLVPPAADLTSATTGKKSDAEILQIITNGKPPTAMPVFKGQLSEQQILDAVAYVRNLGK